MESTLRCITKDNEDFILKLKIKATDGTTQIRRVRLPKVADGQGNVSYDELVGLVVTFTFPDGSPENYTVSLTYFDIDEDAVTIASTDELVDALEQFAGKKVLRITTEVKPKIPSTRTTPGNVFAGVPPPRRADAATSTREQSPHHPQIHNVLESFVGVLSSAVSTLQDNLATPIPPPGALRKSGTNTANPQANVETDEAAADSNEETKEESTNEKPKDIADKELKEVNDDEKPAQGRLEQPTLTKKEEAAPAMKEERPFIHGRHTCDSCLVTPIVGDRYHAVNLQDYDLCEKCFKNYKGTEVKFESVKLDRDRAFQARWNRRRDKIERIEARKANRGPGRPTRPWGLGPGGRGRGRFQNGNCGFHSSRPNVLPGPPTGPPPHRFPPHPECPPPLPGCPPPPGCPPCPPPPPPPGMHPPHWAHIGPHAGLHIRPHAYHHFNHQTGNNELDGALREAIRRSLKDIGAKEDEIFACAPPCDTAKEEVDVVPQEPPVQTEDDIETGSGKTADVEESVKGDVEQPTRPEFDELVFEDAMETGSVDSEMLEKEDADSKPTAVEHETPSESQKSKTNQSFQSEAIGMGEVAEAIGATMDIVAGAIDDILSEANSRNKESGKSNEPSPFAMMAHAIDEVLFDNRRSAARKSESHNVKLAPVKVEPETNEKNSASLTVGSDAAEIEDEYPASVKVGIEASAISGALIMDGTHKSDEVSKEDANEWDVVSASFADDDSVDSKEQIAQATQMLGSALFNSDMKGSETNEDDEGENVSTLSDSFSLPSSVPSISVSTHTSQVCGAQRTRWASQLAQLRELGFEDESLCVETLERLQAANIGVDANDEVSVTQVVNEILEN